MDEGEEPLPSSMDPFDKRRPSIKEWFHNLRGGPRRKTLEREDESKPSEGGHKENVKSRYDNNYERPHLEQRPRSTNIMEISLDKSTS